MRGCAVGIAASSESLDTGDCVPREGAIGIRGYRQTDFATRKWTDVDSTWSRMNLNTEKQVKNRTSSHLPGARLVGQSWTTYPLMSEGQVPLGWQGLDSRLRHSRDLRRE
jgi:hypothetical protein